MTRVTLDIDPFILELLRERAKAERKTMGQLASELLAISLREPAPADQGDALESARR
jgi:hypothetical protein